MKRKIIKQAHQAYTITLPISWVREHDLSEASEIQMSSVGSSLMISSENPVKGESVILDVEGWSERNLYIHITALYAKGVDEIILSAKKDISKIILKVVSNLLGFAIVHQTENTYILKDISGGNYPHLDDMFKRVFQMILFFYDSAIQDIFGEEKENIESLRMRDIEVNKFCSYLQRAVNKMSVSNDVQGRILFTYSYFLEKISDEIERLWRTNIKYKIKKTKELHILLNKSRMVLEKSFDVYYQYHPKMIEEIYRLREDVREQSLRLHKSDAVLMRFIRHTVKIAEDAADLNHLTLMKKAGTMQEK